MPSFREHASHSSLELFDKIDKVQWSIIQQFFPINSPNEASVEFQLETDRNLFLDLQDFTLSLKFSIVKGNRKIEHANDVYLVSKSSYKQIKIYS